MNLVIDIGNTFAKAAVFNGNKLLRAVHFRRKHLNTFEEFLKNVEPEVCAFSSVADNVDDVLQCLSGLQCEVLHITGQTPVPFKNLYRTPETLGSDRLAAVAGAYTLLPRTDVLVVDAGTCITYDFINSEGHYLGGNISAGPNMRFEMLHQYTARLPLVDENGETPLLGYDTTTAIRKGVLDGVRYELKGYIDELTVRYPNLKVVLTGGKRKDIIPNNDMLPQLIQEPYLVEIGLNAILLYNKHELTKQF